MLMQSRKADQKLLETMFDYIRDNLQSKTLIKNTENNNFDCQLATIYRIGDHLQLKAMFLMVFDPLLLTALELAIAVYPV